MQMLYIWPYIAFFSFPVMLPSLMYNLLPLLTSKVVENLPKSLQGFHSASNNLPRLAILIPILATTLVTIHYNTLVHPFTLADNRHYTFYVFRLLTRHPLTKYLVSPLYLFFGWACISALAGMKPIEEEPTPIKKSDKGWPETKPRIPGYDADREAVRALSFILWLLTSALSLASTPLVEPRYFILPWMMWRIQIPLSSITNLREDNHSRARLAGTQKSGVLGALVDIFTRSHILNLETLWLLLVNAVTCYLFLYRGFSWPSEPSSIQRFMW